MQKIFQYQLWHLFSLTAMLLLTGNTTDERQVGRWIGALLLVGVLQRDEISGADQIGER